MALILNNIKIDIYVAGNGRTPTKDRSVQVGSLANFSWFLLTVDVAFVEVDALPQRWHDTCQPAPDVDIRVFHDDFCATMDVTCCWFSAKSNQQEVSILFPPGGSFDVSPSL